MVANPFQVGQHIQEHSPVTAIAYAFVKPANVVFAVILLQFVYFFFQRQDLSRRRNIMVFQGLVG